MKKTITSEKALIAIAYSDILDIFPYEVFITGEDYFNSVEILEQLKGMYCEFYSSKT